MKKISYEKLSEKLENWESEIIDALLQRHPCLSGKRIFVDFQKKDYTKYSAAGEIVVEGKILFPFIVRDRSLEDLDIFQKSGKFYSATKRRIMSALFDYGFFSRMETKEEKKILNTTRNELRNLFGGQDVSAPDASFALGKYASDSFLAKKSGDCWNVFYAGPRGELNSLEKDCFKVAELVSRGLFGKYAGDKELYNQMKFQVRSTLSKLADQESVILCDKKRNSFSIVPEEKFSTKMASEYVGPCSVFDRENRKHYGYVVDVVGSMKDKSKFFVKEGGEYFPLEDNSVIVPEPYLFDLEKFASPICSGGKGIMIVRSGESSGFGPFDIKGSSGEGIFDVVSDLMDDMKISLNGSGEEPRMMNMGKSMSFPSSSFFIPMMRKMQGLSSSPSSSVIIIKIKGDGGAEARGERGEGIVDSSNDDEFINKMNSNGFAHEGIGELVSKIRKALSSGEEVEGSDRVGDSMQTKMKVVDVASDSEEKRDKDEVKQKIAEEINIAEALTNKFTAGEFDPRKYLNKLQKFEDVENSLARMLTELRKSGDDEDFDTNKIEKAVEGLGVINSYLELVKNANK